MKLLLYKIKLALHLGIFLLKVSANYSLFIKPLSVIFFVIIVGTTLYFAVLQPSIEQQSPLIITLRTPQKTELYEQKTLNKTQLSDELNFWLEIEKKQPRSRSLLLTISQLYSALNNQELAEKYLSQAQYIDPNNPLFD